MSELPELFIGGTAAAALAGVNPPRWAQPIDVYLELTGQAPPKSTSRMMGMGKLLEPVVAGLFTEATGIGLRKPPTTRRTCPLCTADGHACTAARSSVYPWAGGHLDRWAADGLPFEAKWGQGRSEWGEGLGVGTVAEPVLIPAPYDESYRPVVPARYAVQVQHYLAVTNRPGAYLAVLLGYGDFRWYVLWRNERMIANLMELEERFYRQHVLAGVPPEPDGSDGYGRHLRSLFAPGEELERVATPEQAALADQLHGLLAEEARVGRAVAAAKQRLMLSMGDTTKLVGDGYTISWKPQKPALRVEWEALATALLKLIVDEGYSAFAPEGWPKTKKAAAQLVRERALAWELAAYDEEGTRPFKPEFDSDEEGTDATA